MAPVNYFLLLNLDPKAPWDDAKFEEALQSAEKKWRATSMPSYPESKRKQAKQYIELIPNIRAVMLDPQQRQQMAQAAIALQDAKRREKLKELVDRIKLHAAKGYLRHEEYESLSREWLALSEDEADFSKLLDQLSVKVLKLQNGIKPLDKRTIHDLETNLKLLGKSSLYDFLGLKPGATSESILRKAEEVYRKAPDGVNKRAEKDAIYALVGIVRSLQTQNKWASYDAYLRWQQIAPLHSYINALKKSGRLLKPQVEFLLQKAAEDPMLQRIPSSELRAIIKEYAEAHDLIVEDVEEASSVYPSGVQLCFLCSYPNPDDADYCARCGKELKIVCPVCQTNNRADTEFCRRCGHNFLDSGERLRLYQEAEGAYQAKRYQQAIHFLNQALQLDGKASPELTRKINSLLANAKVGYDSYIRCREEVVRAQRQRRIREAARTLDAWERYAAEDDPEFQAAADQIKQAVEKADALLKKAEKLHEDPTKRGEAFKLFQQVLELCPDDPIASKRVKTAPPPPPSGIRAHLTKDGKVLIDWDGVRGDDIDYVIEKREGNGQRVPVGMTRKLSIQDTKPAIGVPITYYVFAQRNGALSSPISTKLVEVRTAEVSHLHVQAKDGSVEFSWIPPAAARNILIWRTEKTVSMLSGATLARLPGSEDHFIDNTVSNGKTYSYRIACQFENGLGHPVVSEGIVINSVRPLASPKPVTDLKLTQHVLENGKIILQLQWTPPKAQKTVLLKTRQQPAWSPGTIKTQADLLDCGNVIEVPIGTGDYQDTWDGKTTVAYTIAVIQGDTVVSGNWQSLGSLIEVTNLQLQYISSTSTLRVQWTWPPSIREAQIKYRVISATGTWEQQLNVEGSSRSAHATYQLNLPDARNANVLVTVHTLDNGILSPGVQASLIIPGYVVSYAVKRKWKIGRPQLLLSLTGDTTQPCELPPLMFRCDTRPLNNPEQGKLLIELPTGILVAGRRGLTFDLPISILEQFPPTATIYGRLFVSDTSVSYDPIAHGDIIVRRGSGR